ncbi:hypothetical protein Emag_001075 [Eimeria magna]
MSFASVFAGSRNNGVSFSVLVCLALCLASEIPGGWGATTRAGSSRGFRSLLENGVHASRRQPPVSEMFFDFGRIAGVSSLSSSKALEDLHRALDAAPNRLTVNLPYSGAFAEAFIEYKDTGICKAWTDDKTGRISTGLKDAELYAMVQDRPREVKTDINAIREAADDEDIGRVISLVYRGMRGPLPLISFVIGCVLLILWLFFFSWQACIRSCRKVCCCCMRIKRRVVTGCTLCMAAVMGIGLCAAAVAFVGFGAASVHNSLESIGSSACAAMEMIQAAEWGTPTSDGKIETTYLLPGLMEDNVGAASFVGVRGMVENLNGMSALFSEGFEDNVLSLVKRFFSDSHEIDDRVAAVKRGGPALRKNVEVFRTQAANKGMKSLLVSELDRIDYQYETPIVLAYDKYKQTITEAFNDISLADFGFDQAVDISDMEEGASHLHQFGTDVARIATPFASVTPLLLKVETGLILGGAVLGLIALAFFLLSKGKSSTCVSALTWNYLLVIVSLSFITTGVLFFASSTATQLCNAGVKSIWELRTPTDELDGKDADDGASTDSSALADAGSVLAECMHNPKFNFLEAQGLNEEIEDAKETIRTAESTLLDQLKPIPPISAIADARTVQDWVKDFGVMVVFDKSLLEKDSQMQGLDYTFPEMLKSGIQDKTKTVTLGTGQKEEIYGMQKVQELISPAGIDGYKQATAGNIQVSSTYPTADDEEFKAWLEVQKKKKKEFLQKNESKSDDDADREAADFAKKLKNAVLLTVLKLQLLDGKMLCYRPTETGVVTGECTGRELFGRSSPEWNLIAKSTWELAFAATGLEEAMSTQHTEGRKYVKELFSLLERFIDNIAAAYNCSFVRQNMLEALYLACNEGADHVWGATVARFIGLILGVVLALFIFFIWRIQRDNKDCRPTVPAEENSADQDKNEPEKKRGSVAGEEKSPTEGGKEIAGEAPTPV